MLARQSQTLSQRAWLCPLLVLVVGILSYIPWLGSYGPLDPTDSFFLESAREALETNQFLLPLDNYVPWLDKPILFFWLVEYSFKLFGIHTFTGRLPAALSAIAASLLIYFGCRPMLRRSTALIASIIFLATPLSSIVGHVCLTDMTLSALIAGSLLFLFKGLEFRSTKNLIIGYFCLGLAMLCKGPIAIVICGLALLPYLISISKSKSDLFNKIETLKPLIGMGIILALNLPWYIAASIATNGKFFITFFFTQNFGRMVGTVNHQEKFYFYIPVFFGGFFPWCALSLSAAGVFKKSFQQRNNENSTFRRFLRLCVFWFISVLALFSAIKTKLPTYILPSVPAFSILIAMQLELILRTGKLKRMIPALTLVSIALAVGAAVQSILKGYVREIITENLWVFIPVTVGLIISWLAIAQNKPKLFVASFVSCILFACSIMVPRGLQTFYQSKQIGFGKLADRARDDNANVAMIYAEEPSLPWTIHKPVSRLMERADAEKFLKDKAPPHYVFVQTSSFEQLEWFANKPRLIDESGKWHLYNVDPQ